MLFRHSLCVLLVGAWSSGLVLGLPRLRRRDADFQSVRTRLVEDYSGKAGDPKDKYFHESTV